MCVCDDDSDDARKAEVLSSHELHSPISTDQQCMRPCWVSASSSASSADQAEVRSLDSQEDLMCCSSEDSGLMSRARVVV